MFYIMTTFLDVKTTFILIIVHMEDEGYNDDILTYEDDIYSEHCVYGIRRV